MRRRGKVDSNHAEIRDALRACGWRVLSLADLGGGAPDLLLFRAEQRLRLVEVKRPGGKLTPAQKQFLAEGWPVTILESVEDALAL